MDYNKIFHVDSFTDIPFRGNPAGVCILEKPICDEQMQNIAREMCLSETAFVSSDSVGSFEIRWFTPKFEVDLCGHATMAAAKILYDFYNIKEDWIAFNSKSGVIRTFRNKDEIMLDFPIDEVEREVDCSPELLQALGIKTYKKAVIGKNTRKLIIHLEDFEEVQIVMPNSKKLMEIGFDTVVKGIGVTSDGYGKYDFITRYFNPWAGVDEDPVTGSVHTLLASYWSKILNKNELLSYQASERGGEIRIKLADNKRVELWGKAVVVAVGDMLI